MTYLSGVGAGGNARLQRVALSRARVDARERGRRCGARAPSRDGVRAVGASVAAVDLGPEREALGGLLDGRGAGEERAPEEERDAAAEEARLAGSDRRAC